MDLTKMQRKLDAHQYISLKQFDSDVQLMVRNCRKFNGAASPFTKVKKLELFLQYFVLYTIVTLSFYHTDSAVSATRVGTAPRRFPGSFGFRHCATASTSRQESFRTEGEESFHAGCCPTSLECQQCQRCSCSVQLSAGGDDAAFAANERFGK